MIFVIRSDRDFSRAQTQVWPLALETVDGGPLEGTPYFIATGEAPKTVARDCWPPNFLQGELLDTDADDTAALLALQNAFGQIASPVFMTDAGKVTFRFASSPALASHRRSLFREEREGAALSLEVNEYLREQGGTMRPSAVSVAEASAALKTLQALVRATTRAQAGESGVLDEALSHTFVALANALKHQFFEPYACCEDEDEVNIEVVDVPFVPSAVFSQMKELSEAKAYRICAECGRWKPYLRKVPKPAENSFCCETCRNAFTSRQQYQRRKANEVASRRKEG